ncbi:hypothetical protein DPMN_013799 [Dreissena polymorpha]|uniref:Uncharacterized protein n=1 Tax=Dreissena polymorpha TaxID=45954 RepID=A0A9D4NAH1_DREPO|nr:hypothetical protein DPMN_013799 [Dreissena polymorpha]
MPHGGTITKKTIVGEGPSFAGSRFALGERSELTYNWVLIITSECSERELKKTK